MKRGFSLVKAEVVIMVVVVINITAAGGTSNNTISIRYASYLAVAVLVVMKVV